MKRFWKIYLFSIPIKRKGHHSSKGVVKRYKLDIQSRIKRWLIYTLSPFWFKEVPLSTEHPAFLSARKQPQPQPNGLKLHKLNNDNFFAYLTGKKTGWSVIMTSWVCKMISNYDAEVVLPSQKKEHNKVERKRAWKGGVCKLPLHAHFAA